MIMLLLIKYYFILFSSEYQNILNNKKKIEKFTNTSEKKPGSLRKKFKILKFYTYIKENQNFAPIRKKVRAIHIFSKAFN